MEQTPNYHLNKPARSEKVNVDLLNQNMDIVDRELNNTSNNLSSTLNGLNSHVENKANPHNVTKKQLGLENVENKSSSTIRGEITKANVTNALGYTPYTPNEIDNKFSTLETKIDWKEAVNAYTDIASTYPSPEDGWTVNVKDTDYTYRYNGEKWVAISANAIPKATSAIDGLLSKEDYANFSDANSKKHTHSNKTVIDGITSDLINKWNNTVSKSGDTMTGNLTVPQLIDSGVTANRVITSNSDKQLVSSNVTDTELGYLSGVKSSIQNQINNLNNATGNTSNIVWHIGYVDSGNFSQTLKDVVGGASIASLTDVTKKVPANSCWKITQNSQSVNAWTNTMPTTGSGTLLFYIWTDNTRGIAQFQIHDSANPRLWIATYANSTWSSWVEIANKNDINGKVNKTGDTMSGNLTVPKLNNYDVNSANTFNRLATIQNNGVMEVGRYLDFHYASGESNDYSARLEVTGQGNQELRTSGNFVANGGLYANGERVFARYGSTVWQENGARQDGYVRLFTITIKGSYTNMPIVIELARRAAQTTCTLYIHFTNANSTDPTLEAFVYEGTNYDAHLVRTGSGVWDLYAWRSESADHINIVRLHKPEFMNSVTITYQGNATGTVNPGGTVATFGGQAAAEINSLKNSVKTVVYQSAEPTSGLVNNLVWVG